MAPRHRKFIPKAGIELRQAAVLILLYPDPLLGISLLFTLRPHTLRHHPGEISLPGGGRDPEDRDLQETALREAREELGISTLAIQILGTLTPLYIPPTNYCLNPFVGWIDNLPQLHPYPAEVAEVYHVTLNQLLEPETRKYHKLTHQGETYLVPVYQFPNFFIWGATAMVLSEFLTLVEPLWKG